MRTSAEVEEFESILVLASLDVESALVIREKRGGEVAQAIFINGSGGSLVILL